MVSMGVPHIVRQEGLCFVKFSLSVQCFMSNSVAFFFVWIHIKSEKNS